MQEGKGGGRTVTSKGTDGATAASSRSIEETTRPKFFFFFFFFFIVGLHQRLCRPSDVMTMAKKRRRREEEEIQVVNFLAEHDGTGRAVVPPIKRRRKTLKRESAAAAHPTRARTNCFNEATRRDALLAPALLHSFLPLDARPVSTTFTERIVDDDGGSRASSLLLVVVVVVVIERKEGKTFSFVSLYDEDGAALVNF